MRERLPALDGLRGLAVLGVIILHARVLPERTGADWVWTHLVHGGVWGVDLFFVLSGFLITGVLLEARGSASYYRAFYTRRVLRIFPLYYAVLAFLLFVAPHLPLGEVLNSGAEHGREWLYATYLGNVVWLLGNPWPDMPFSIMWTLAIEEQFYLVWPLVVARLNRGALALTCVALVAISTALLWFAPQSPIPLGLAPQFLLPFRMEGLAVGALVAIAMRTPALQPRMRRYARFGAAICGGLMLKRFFDVPDLDVVGTWWHTPLAGFFASVLVLALPTHGRSVTRRSLEAGWLRDIGRVSYGMYLLHAPVLLVLTHTVLQPLLSPSVPGSTLPAQFLVYTVTVALTWFLAQVSWRYFEAPLLSLSPWATSRPAPAPRPPMAAAARSLS